MATSGSILGNAVRRLEDPTLLTGEGKYVDDLVETNTLHVAFVRSPIAHANLSSIDTSDAASMPGIVAIYSGDDLGVPSLQGFQMMPETLNRPIFAAGKVRFVGDIVAAVVGESRAQAMDAAEQVGGDYDPLPAGLAPLEAMGPGAPPPFPPHGAHNFLGPPV